MKLTITFNLSAIILAALIFPTLINAQESISTEQQETYDGVCLMGANNSSDPDFTGVHDTGKQGCENHHKNSSDSYYWLPNSFPMIYLSTNKSGKGLEIKQSIANLATSHPDFAGKFRSYHLPATWQAQFCTDVNYQGSCYTRSFNQEEDEDNFEQSADIRSIKVWSDKDELPQQITSTKQVFFGNPNQLCSSFGRLLTHDDVDSIKQNENLCQQVKSPWSIWKIQGRDGTNWSFMGYRYQCQIKQGVSEHAVPLCVMKPTPAMGQVFLYAGENYSGLQSWQGKADVKSVGEQQPNTSIRSFLLSDNTQLKAYTKQNFQGEETTHTNSTATLKQEIKSYKIEARN